MFLQARAVLCGLIADALDRTEADERLRRDDQVAQGLENQRCGPPSPVILEMGLFISETDSVHLISLRASCGELDIKMDTTRVDDDFVLTFKDHSEPDVSTDSAKAMQVAKKKGFRLAGKMLPILPAGKRILIKRKVTASQDGPVLMRDAISVTRALGYRYPWIDALCIVQDDDKDWAHEAAGMHAIYSLADLIMSSLVASDCHTELFQPRVHRVVHSIPLGIWEPKRNRQPGNSLAAVPKWLGEDPGIHGPVHSRAWMLQEQLLSPRILYFGNGTLHWECLNGYRLEADPAGNHTRAYNCRIKVETRVETKRAIKATLSNDTNHSGTSSGRLRPFEFWKMQLEAYTRRSLTKPSDRLAAFVSISKSLAGVTGNQFLCGVWSGDKMLESLCWRVVQPRSRSRMPNMPSWSWASVAGEISFDPVDRSGRADVEILAGSTVVFLEFQANDSLSRVSGFLNIRSKLYRQKPLELSLSKAVKARDRWVYDYDSNIRLDHIFETREDIYATDVLSFPRGPPPKGYGYPRWPEGRSPTTLRLLLQKVNDESNVFRRVGIALPSDILFDRDFARLYIEEDEWMTSDKWLVMNGEVSEDQEIVIV